MSPQKSQSQQEHRSQDIGSDESVAGMQPLTGTGRVVVLGMHRSGTSALTGALSGMGLFVGDKGELTGRSSENHAGFFERRDARSICDALLHGSDADWWKVSNFSVETVPHAIFAEQSQRLRNLIKKLDARGPWVLKEPRLCLLLPFLEYELPEVLTVIIVRNPLEVAKSLRRRNGFSIQAGLALWEAYNVAAITNTRRTGQIFVDYAELVDRPRATLGSLAAELTAQGIAGLTLDATKGTINRALHREIAGQEETTQRLSVEQRELWEQLSNRRVRRDAPIVISERAVTHLREFEADEATRRVTSGKFHQAEARLLADQAAQETQKTEARLAELEQAHKADLAALNAMRERRQSTALELSKRSSTIDALRAELADSRSRAQQLAGKLGILSQKDHEQTAEISAMKATAHRLQTEIAAVAERARTQEQLADQAAQETQKTEARLAELEQAHKADTVLIAQRDHKIETLNAQLSYISELHSLLRARTDLDRAARARGWRFRRPLWSARVLAGKALRRSPRRSAVVSLIRESPLFDRAWYLNHHPDVATCGVDPAWHYVASGARELRDPGPAFSTAWYLASNEDVRRRGINSLAHYELYGRQEGRAPRPSLNSLPRQDAGVTSCVTPPEGGGRIVEPCTPPVPIRRGRRGRPGVHYDVVAYTANAGSYDLLRAPEVSQHCDLVCFTDAGTGHSDDWALQPFDYHNADPTRTARYVKTHPHVYFPDHEWSIWVDANLGLKVDLKGLIDELPANAVFAAYQHPHRDCVYEEAEEIIARDLDDSAVVRAQVERYREAGHPPHAGLIETNVLVRRHGDPRCIRLMNTWWKEINNGSRRDQLSIGIAARRENVTLTPLAPPGTSVRDDPRFQRYHHGKSNEPA